MWVCVRSNVTTSYTGIGEVSWRMLGDMFNSQSVYVMRSFYFEESSVHMLLVKNEKHCSRIIQCHM